MAVPRSRGVTSRQGVSVPQKWTLVSPQAAQCSSAGLPSSWHVHQNSPCRARGALVPHRRLPLGSRNPFFVKVGRGVAPERVRRRDQETAESYACSLDDVPLGTRRETVRRALSLV
jgi:hypothetical protein